MYVHLHTHSYYSILEGLSSPKALVERAKEIGSPALGLTDKTSMHGCIDFYKACKDADIKPVIGTEVYVAETSRFDQTPKTGTRRHNLILLASSHQGYKNLLTITTKAHTEGFYYKPRVDKELLKECREGLIALSSDHWGEVAQSILRGLPLEEAYKVVQEYQEIFGKENFFLELIDQPHIIGRDKVNEGFIELSSTKEVPLIVTNNVHYAKPEDKEAHEVILCLQTGKDFDDPSRFSMREGDYSLRSWEDLQKAFPGQETAFQNTVEIANRCSYDFQFGVNLIPKFDIPEEETEVDTEEMYFRKLCYGGLLWRYPEVPLSKEELPLLIKKENYAPLTKDLKQTSPEELKVFAEESFSEEKKELLKALPKEARDIVDRLEYEMCVINEMGFCTYFLIVHDFVAWAKERSIGVGPGRGSAAGALITYCLSITDVDPLTYSLLFERFLNPARVSMPDIDLDFEDARREEVLDYVRNKYGQYNVAGVATFGTLKAKQAVKDVGRSLGVPYAEMDKVAKLMTEKLGTKLKDIMDTNPDIKAVIKSSKLMERVFNLALKLEGVVRQVGVHACAYMISEKSLLEYTAMQHPPKAKEAFITQYSMKPLEALGLLKMDFLGLRNLTVMQRSVDIIKAKKGVDIDLSSIPLDDKKTYELFARGETKGVFQFESEGMRKCLKDVKPDTLEDLIAIVSLYRPGPMKWIPVYVGLKHDQKIEFPDDEAKKNFSSLTSLLEKYPEVKEILIPSNLIPIYQEQILQIAQRFAGFSLGEADLLRRAIGKKIAEELIAQKQKFIDGAVALGRSKEDAVFLFERGIEPFADYGFNKSHAACYAFIAYRTGYLKAHYPTEFMTGLLTTVEDATDKLIVQLQDCQHMGIKILPPSVNESGVHFTAIKDGEIRFGLNAIKGLGIEVAKEIKNIREMGGPFTNIEDFLERCPSNIINKKTLEALSYGGAFDDFDIPRDTFGKNVDVLLTYMKSHKQQASSGQIDLFADLDDESFSQKLHLENPSPDSRAALLKKEKDSLGFYVTAHPLQGLTSYLKKGAKQIRDLNNSWVNRKVTLVTMVAGMKKLLTKKNDMMAFLDLEDATGEIPAVVFPKTYADASSHLRDDVVLKVRGKYELRNGEPQLLIEELKELNLDKLISSAKELGLYDPEEERVYHVENEESEETEDTKKQSQETGLNQAPNSQDQRPKPQDLGPKSEEAVSIEAQELILPLSNPNPAFLQSLKATLSAMPEGETKITLDIQGKKISTSFEVELDEVNRDKLLNLAATGHQG